MWSLLNNWSFFTCHCGVFALKEEVSFEMQRGLNKNNDYDGKSNKKHFP